MTPEDAYIKARYYCAQQERCRFDIRRKLFDWKVEPQYFDRILSDLEKENFLSEMRFAGLYVKSKLNQNRWGPVKIRAELARRGIPEHIIDEAIDRIDQNVLTENMSRLATSKRKELDARGVDNKEEKLKMYLYSRGYEASFIMNFLNNK